MVASQIAVLAEHAVTGNDEGDRVSADRRADGAGGGRPADMGGDVGIGGGGAERQLEQGLPDAELEIRADHDDPERPVRSPGRRIEDAPCRRLGGLDILDVSCARPARLHVGERRRLLARIGKGEAGKPAVGDHDQRGAEGRGVEAVAHGEPLAACLVGARRHRLVADEEIVQPAGAGEADLIGGVEHRGRISQKRAGVIQRQGLNEALGRQAGPAGEQALQGERLHADMGGDALQRRLLAPAPGDEGDRAADDLVVRHRGVEGVGVPGGGCRAGHDRKVHRGVSCRRIDPM